MTTKPRTYNADLAHLPSALVPLTEEQRWVVWPWELRTTKSGKEKWTKPPRQARNPRRNARSNDPATWGSYMDAVAAVVDRLETSLPSIIDRISQLFAAHKLA